MCALPCITGRLYKLYMLLMLLSTLYGQPPRISPPTSKPSIKPRRPTITPKAVTRRPTLTPRSRPTAIPTRVLSVTPSAAPSAFNIPKFSQKRGMVNNGNNGDIVGKNVAWFYNYKMTRIPTYVDIPRPYVQDPVSIPFVPMVKSRDCITRLLLNRTFDGVVPEVLLGFNEPDGPIVNISVQEALQLWPILESTKATRLGSPACMRKSIDKWLPFFMNGNGTYKPRVDILTLHWYERNATEFLLFVDKWYRRYRLPIWVTEFSFADFGGYGGYTVEHIKEFIRVSVTGLENRPFVERYSWFSDACNFGLRDSSLWTTVTSYCDGPGAQLNELGELYLNYESTAEPSRMPTPSPTIKPSMSSFIPTLDPTPLRTKTPTTLPPC